MHLQRPCRIFPNIERRIMSVNQGKLRDNSTDSLRAAAKALRHSWVFILCLILVSGIAGLLYSLAREPVYRSTATLYVTSGNEGDSSTAYQGSLAAQQRVESYKILIRSDAVVSDALGTGGIEMSIDEAKSAVLGSSSPDTVMLDVTADSTDKNEAAALSNAVAASLVGYVAEL